MTGKLRPLPQSKDKIMVRTSTDAGERHLSDGSARDAIENREGSFPSRQMLRWSTLILAAVAGILAVCGALDGPARRRPTRFFDERC